MAAAEQGGAGPFHHPGGHAEVGPAVVGGLGGRVDDLVGPEGLGQAAAGGREVGRQDRPVAPALEGGDDGQADRAAPHHQARLARLEPGEPDGVLAHGQRFGQRGQVGVERVGYGQEQHLLEHHVLGQGARVEVGVADLLDAGRGHDDGHRADPRAHRQGPAGVGSVLDDLGAELVAEDAVRRRIEGGDADRVHQPGEVREVGQRVEVGPADAGGQRAHQHVARTRCGVGHLTHDEGPAPGHRSLHVFSPTPTDRLSHGPSHGLSHGPSHGSSFLATFAR